MSMSIAIDPNLRVNDNATLAGFEDVRSGSVSGLRRGVDVVVREPESGAEGRGRIVAVDRTKRLVEVAVDWASMRVPTRA